MKQFQQLCAAVVLVLVLTFSVFAGQMDTGFVPPQPNPPVTSNGQMDTGRSSEVSTPATGQMDTTVIASATEIARNLLLSVLSLI